MLTTFSELMAALTAALKALKPALEALPFLMLWLSNNKLDTLNEQILQLEEAADPANRARLGELRVKQAAARKFHETLVARLTPSEGGVKSTNP